jgi:hypothetical protein
MALDAHPSSYSGSAWKAFFRNRTVVSGAGRLIATMLRQLFPDKSVTPASIERDRPGLDCGDAELTTFMLGTARINLLSPCGDRGTISTGDRRGGGSMHA